MKKGILLLVIILLVSLWTVGCSDNVQDNNGTDQTPKENGEVIEDDDNENSADDQNNENNGTGEEQTVEGSFTGWIDNNSFEIMSDNEPVVIRTNPDVTLPEESLEGKRVRIDYTTNEQGQNIIKDIEVMD